ncbi:hypothetical protein PV326_001323 [Microctonus aethiopoides]|nr:hypothetical protein PV326_001323 [Microctonus aethiopoides]
MKTIKDNKLQPNLKSTRGKLNTSQDIKDFTTDVNPVPSETTTPTTATTVDNAEWRSPNKTSRKISHDTDEPVSTATHNKFAPLSNVDDVNANLETIAQLKKTSLPIYVVAENCQIKDLAKLRRENQDINGNSKNKRV